MSDPNALHPYEPYHPLFGCQLKMRRADEHFEALQNSMHDFMGRNPYEVIQDFDFEANQYIVGVKSSPVGRGDSNLTIAKVESRRERLRSGWSLKLQIRRTGKPEAQFSRTPHTGN